MLTIDVLSLLCIAGAAQLFLMATVFAPSSALPQRIFAALAFDIGVIIAGAVLLQSVPQFPRVHVPFNYLLGPLFYLFVRATLTGEVGRRIWAHAIPSFICALALIALKPQRMELLIALILQSGIYLALTFRLLRRHDRADLRLWLSASVFAVIWLGAFARLTGTISMHAIPAALAVCGIGVSGALLRTRVVERKYARSSLDAEQGETHLRRILTLFEAEKPFLDPELSLDDLGRRLAIPPKHVSQIVNHHLGRNFNEWINGWRVEEAKRRLIDRKFRHLSIVAIGEASGFRSKSTFNSAFRRETSMTPSEYRRRRLE